MLELGARKTHLVAQEQDTDQDLGELENRLERLRILYEQYFMGIEKREPGVQHKDVERRIAQLRKVRFQSTASRFKFQTMVQRFNTLQQYWTRTCREIENGTYHRHVQRAARRLATVPPADATQNEQFADGALREKAREAAAADLGALLSEDIDLDAEMAGALAAVEKATAPLPKTLSALGTAKENPRLPASPTLQLGKAPPLTSVTPNAKPSIRPGLSTSPKPAGLAPIIKPNAAGNPLAALGKASPASPAAAKTVELHSPTPAATAPKAPAPVAPARAPAPAPLPAVAAKAMAKKGAPPPAPSLRPQEKRPATTAQADSGLTSDRIKALHASYVQARKQTNAAPVSYEKLEKNIRETEKKLREEHKGRQVDFEVGIKDGKAILKPRLK